jgi:hypothetical protein
MKFDAFNPAKNPAWAMFVHSQAFNAKLFELGAANFLAAVKVGNDLARIRTPWELSQFVVNQTRERFESFTEQIELLSLTAQGEPAVKDAELGAGFGD